MAISNSVIRPVFGPVFFLTIFLSFSCLQSAAADEIKLAIIDSGFCPESRAPSTKVKIDKPLDMTGTLNFNCAAYTKKEKQTSRRFHGQWVLETFLGALKTKHSVRIVPLIVFDKEGNQQEEAWKKSLDFIKKEGINLTIAALGFNTPKAINSELSGIWMVASGKAEGNIKKEMTFFPHMLAPKENLILIGDFFSSPGRSDLYDQNLLYQEFIDFHFAEGGGHFKGTSRAVALAGARALNICAEQLHLPAQFRQCLQKNAKKHRDPFLKKDFLSF